MPAAPTTMPADPVAATRKKLARLLAVGAMRAAAGKGSESGRVSAAPTAGPTPGPGQAHIGSAVGAASPGSPGVPPAMSPRCAR